MLWGAQATLDVILSIFYRTHRWCSQALDVLTLLFGQEVVVYKDPWFPRHQLHPSVV
jgi:hypothetical protein